MVDKDNQELQHLLEFINQCPFGLVKADAEGNIMLINAEATQLLLPLAFQSGKSLDNILDIIKFYDESFFQEIRSYKEDYGRMCSNRRIIVAITGTNSKVCLSFTIGKINQEIYQYSFKEVSNIIEYEEKMKSVVEANALQAGKLEMSSGILHDIGNAVTAFGSEIAKLQQELQWRELNDLKKLIKLFDGKSEKIDEALGPGKGKALLKFLHALNGSLNQRQTDISGISTQLYETTRHIQEILNIQRHYVKGKKKGERAPVKLRNIIEDALSIQERTLEKRGITITKDIPLDIPEISGDKTKLIQVVINILKNAGEAFDEVHDDREKEMSLALSVLENEPMIELLISDNAIGLEPQIGPKLLEKGNTSKNTGTGFGLYNCKQIIETHQGEIDISSEGPNLGAKVRLTFPLMEKDIHLFKKKAKAL